MVSIAGFPFFGKNGAAKKPCGVRIYGAGVTVCGFAAGRGVDFASCVVRALRYADLRRGGSRALRCAAFAVGGLPVRKRLPGGERAGKIFRKMYNKSAGFIIKW